MADASITTAAIGREREPLVTIDDLAPSPDALRQAAAAAAFGAAGEHYPGIRAALPEDYLPAIMPTVLRAAAAYGRVRRLHVIDASFSIVTTAPDALTLRQRVPHCDAFARERLALIHYLAPDDIGGTAFYRHRATGFETIDERRRGDYFAALEQEVAVEPPTGYIAGDTPLFERIALGVPRFNRAYLYRSWLLHSGALPPGAPLSPDPLTGRLTVTAFFMAG